MVSYSIARKMDVSRFYKYLYFFLLVGIFVPFQVKMMPLINWYPAHHLSPVSDGHFGLQDGTGDYKEFSGAAGKLLPGELQKYTEPSRLLSGGWKYLIHNDSVSGRYDRSSHHKDTLIRTHS